MEGEGFFFADGRLYGFDDQIKQREKKGGGIFF
jgi:hypothetical protein